VARESQYVHGSEPAEQDRLRLLNALLNQRHLDSLGLRGGERVLELGAGTGVFALELARAVGARGSVVAVERDARQLATARELLGAHPEGARVDLRAGDAAEAPLAADEWESFDLTHARFLLEHVQHPQTVVHTLVRAARAGGRIVLADDDHDVLRFHPEPPAAEALFRAYLRTYTARGNDPFVGRRLVSLLSAAGAEPVRNDWAFFGGCAGDGRFPAVVANLRAILVGARAAVLEFLAVEEFDAGLAAYDAWGALPDAALWYAMAWAEGRR
jgi:ubiquinone/menaquinone biosynthesis C-methylase UbiE